MMSGERKMLHSVMTVRCSSGVRRLGEPPAESVSRRRPSGSMSASGQPPPTPTNGAQSRA